VTAKGLEPETANVITVILGSKVLVSLSGKDRNAALRPIETSKVTSVRSLVVQSLRQAILHGEMAPGERFTQAHLAEKLGVSRQPVREAVRELEAEGLLEQEPRGQVFVKKANQAEIREIYMIRALLEGKAAELAAEHLEEPDIEKLEDLNRSMAIAIEERKGEEYFRLNGEFHAVIHEASRSPYLVKLLRQVWVRFRVNPPIFLPARVTLSADEHRRIVRALKSKDARRASVLMHEHVIRSGDDYLEYISGEGAGDISVLR